MPVPHDPCASRQLAANQRRTRDLADRLFNVIVYFFCALVLILDLMYWRP